MNGVLAWKLEGGSCSLLREVVARRTTGGIRSELKGLSFGFILGVFEELHASEC